MGRNATLGRHDTTRPVQLRTETALNIGNTQQNQLSISLLTESIANSFNNPPPMPIRTIAVVENDYHRITNYLYEARQNHDDEAITLWTTSRRRLEEELARLVAADTAELVPRAMSSNEESGSNNE
jgi:hypothetical protein